jgi:hypothetical protein
VQSSQVENDNGRHRLAIGLTDEPKLGAHVDVPSVDRPTAIWERVLNRSPVFPDDNFFDIGGDYFLAF